MIIGLAVSRAKLKGLRLLLAFPDALCEKCSVVSGGIGSQMQVLRYFSLPSSSSMIPRNINLVDSHCLTFLHKPCCCKLLQPGIFCCYYLQILAKTLFCLLAHFLRCSAPAVTCEKHHKFSIFLAIQACMLAFQLVELLKKV